MNEFVGQKNLLKIINNYTIQNLPHTILLLGEEGSGKKTIVKILSNKLGLDLVVIDEKVDQEKLSEYQNNPIKTLYMIDLSKFTLEKEQNQFLKFIEEPSNSVYIILINTSEVGILPTIINRCQKLRTDIYNISELRQVKSFSNELAYKVCRTPGQLILIDEKSLANLYTLCEAIVTKINNASYTNMISVEARINYKEDYNKYSFETFLNMLEYVSLELFITKKDDFARKVYLYTVLRRQELIQNSRIQKEAFMINFLAELWKETR